MKLGFCYICDSPLSMGRSLELSCYFRVYAHKLICWFVVLTLNIIGKSSLEEISYCKGGVIMKEWKENFSYMEAGHGGFKDIDYKSYQPENFVIDIEIGNCGWKHTCKPT